MATFEIRKQSPNVIGLVPAAGKGERVAPLPCSKEIFPIGFSSDNRPKPVCNYLLESMRCAGIRKIYIILGRGKWDIPNLLGYGAGLDLSLAYLMVGLPYGPPYTLDQAYDFVGDSRVVMGFPDIVFQPSNAFERLLERQSLTNAEVVLGLFQARPSQEKDIVDFKESGKVERISTKPLERRKRHTWIIAAWTPIFARFMHEHLAARENSEATPNELSMGEVIQSGIENGLTVDSVLFSEGSFLDIGTPEDLLKGVSQGGVQGTEQ